MKKLFPKKHALSFRGSTCSVVIQASGTTLLSLETSLGAFMTQIEIPRIRNFITISREKPKWRVRNPKVPPHLQNGTGLRHVLTLQPGKKPAFIAFCLGAISRDTALKVLDAFPTVCVVACNQGLMARTEVARTRPTIVTAS